MPPAIDAFNTGLTAALALVVTNLAALLVVVGLAIARWIGKGFV